MSPYAWSLAVWGGIWLGLFLTLEVLALLDVVPWNTFSWTFAQVAARNRVMALALFGGTAALLLHLNFGWPTRKGTRPEREDTEGKR